MVVSHPIALNDDSAIIGKADGAIEEIVGTLIDDGGASAARKGI